MMVLNCCFKSEIFINCQTVANGIKNESAQIPRHWCQFRVRAALRQFLPLGSHPTSMPPELQRRCTLRRHRRFQKTWSLSRRARSRASIKVHGFLEERDETPLSWDVSSASVSSMPGLNKFDKSSESGICFMWTVSGSSRLSSSAAVSKLMSGSMNFFSRWMEVTNSKHWSFPLLASSSTWVPSGNSSSAKSASVKPWKPSCWQRFVYSFSRAASDILLTFATSWIAEHMACLQQAWNLRLIWNQNAPNHDGDVHWIPIHFSTYHYKCVTNSESEKLIKKIINNHINAYHERRLT